MTIEISSETEQLLQERMQTGWFVNEDEAIHQALDMSPPARRERELMKTLLHDGSDVAPPVASQHSWAGLLAAAQALGGIELDLVRESGANSERELDFS